MTALMDADETQVTVWDRQEAISRQLKAWGMSSMLAGSAVAVAGWVGPDRFRSSGLRAFGIQTAAWGAIDTAIAVFGDMRRRGKMEVIDPEDSTALAEEARGLRRILLGNAGLDVGYIALGAVGLAKGLKQAEFSDSALAGHGAAVLVQGLFLLGFDAGHARQVPSD